MKLARKGFQISLDISKSLGFDSDYVSYTKNLSFLPFKKEIFKLGTKLLYSPKPINENLRLFYE